jgi:eukaryotic-like serine/threonine-protein kinase
MTLPAREDGSTGEQGASRPRVAEGVPVLKKYELIEELGHGGMATVYRARDPRLGREVAVKIIHRHLRENAEVAARFVAEARAAAKLRHPGIVEVYDVSSEQDGERYLVVELLRGCTLRKILQSHRDMPAEVGASLVLELCDALEHAHASGIIHRDVKPENVLVELPADRGASEGTTDGTGVVIKLTDFGIAKVLDAQGVTSTGQVLGSPAHMAPEQIDGGDVDVRTDVFALGVLLYECLVGHLPFEGKNPAQVLRKVLEGAFAAADRERPSVGGRWSSVVAGALAHEVSARTASPRALAELIRAELSALGITEPRAELAAYFADPAAYTARHAARLVPRLVARGEACRKGGDVPGAAADYNRALALAPQDLSILKRLTSLNSSASRRQLGRRIVAVVVGSATLGVAAFAVARWLRGAAPRVVDDTAALPDVPMPAPAISPRSPRDVQAVAPSASPPVSAPRPRGRVTPPYGGTAASSAAAEPREVRFQIIPTGAKLVLDGNETAWFGRTVTLLPGAHNVQISVPDSKCCKPFVGAIHVVPAAAGELAQPQRIVHRLDMLPSSVLLSGAPPNAQFTCPQLGLTGFAGTPQTVTLPDVAWRGPCEFTPPSPGAEPHRQSVTLRAGEANTIGWPLN